MNSMRPIPLSLAPPAVVALLLLAAIGFWVPYFSQLTSASGYVHLHVATMVAWMGLLIFQPLLMRAGRVDLHRAVGKSTYVLIPLVMVAGVLLAHHRLSQPGQLDQPGMLQLLVLQIVSPMLLAGFYGMAMANRHTPAVHARWMLVTAILLIDPIVARVLIFYFPHHADAAEWLGPILAISLTLGLILAERDTPSCQRVFSILLVCLLAQTALFYTLGQSSLWRHFAHWFVALPLT